DPACERHAVPEQVPGLDLELVAQLTVTDDGETHVIANRGDLDGGREERGVILDRNETPNDPDDRAVGRETERCASRGAIRPRCHERLEVEPERDHAPLFGAPDAEPQQLVADRRRYG